MSNCPKIYKKYINLYSNISKIYQDIHNTKRRWGRPARPSAGGRPMAPGPVVGLCSLEFKVSGGTVLPWGRRRDVALEMVAAGAARVREEPSLHAVPSHATGMADDGTDAPVVDVLSVEALQLLVARLERLEEAQAQAQAEGLGVWEGNMWKAPPSGAGGGSAHVLRSLRDAALERVLPPIIQRVASWRHRKRTGERDN